jgi:hypothetical protein
LSICCINVFTRTISLPPPLPRPPGEGVELRAEVRNVRGGVTPELTIDEENHKIHVKYPFQEKMNNTTKNHSEQLNMLRNQLATSYNQQFEDLKKKYEDLDLQRQKSSRENFDEKTAEYKHKMDELNRQIIELQQRSQEVKENAFNDARTTLQKELHDKEIGIRERDAQIRQYKESIEELKQQLSSTQPERRGETWEQDLLEDLRRAFPEDQFNRQTRGISEGDIIQRIRTPSGTLLKVPIV